MAADFPKSITEQYAVLEPLRPGGFSRVFRARQKSTGQEVAIKLLSVDDGGDPALRESQVARFRREARFCADLHHPNIVPLVDFGETETGEAFAVFSFVPGTDLGSLLEAEGPLEASEALHFMTQVIDGISCAHARGIVHRDLKPENIMINVAGARRNALVLDFGIGAITADREAMDLVRVTKTGDYLGTPAYSAPEQFRGAPPDLRSDLYAWGLVFLDCLTGRSSKKQSVPYEMVYRHFNPAPIPIPAALTGTELGKVLRTVTQKNVDDRKMTSAEVLAALQRVAGGSLPSRAAFESSGSPAGVDRTPQGAEAVSQVRSSSRLSSRWLVPLARNPNFVGREKALREIRASLQTSPVLAVVALHGLGGVGKSQLALEYAYQRAGDYGLVAWIHAEHPETIAAGYSSIGAALGLPDAGNEHEMLATVRSWLEQNGGWLLVFDNVRDPEAIRMYLPRAHDGHVLVTSRHQGWRGLAASMMVDVLERREAIEFLLRRTGETDETCAAQLSQELGRLPLALEEAAAYIEATGRSIANYIPLFRVHREGVLQPSTDKLGALQATWELSFREIEQYAPSSSDLLKVCAFLAPDDIPRALFRAGSDRTPATLREPLCDEVAFDACIATLRRYSFIRRDPDSLAIHRLVQLATRERLSKAEQAQWTSFALSLIESAYPANAIAGAYLPESTRLLPHALAVLSHPACDDVSPELAARVLQRAGVYLSTRGQQARAREQLERALALFERAKAPSTQIAGTLWELGMVLYALGEGVSARERLGRARDILAPQTTPTERALYAETLITLAWVLRTLGEFDAARSAAQRCLELAEQRAPHHALVAMSLALIARSEWSLNRIEESRVALRRAVEVAQQVRNPLPFICGTWYVLAQVHFDLGDFNLALECAAKGFAIGEPAYGRDHPYVCLITCVRGCILRRRGDLIAARRDLESTLEIGQRTCQHLHEDMAIARCELAGVLRLEGDSEGALQHLKRALADIPDLCGDPARVEGQTRFALSTLLRERGDLAGARDECMLGLRAVEARYGDSHPLRIAGLDALGWVLRDEGNIAGAEAALREACRIAEQAKLQRHPDYAESLAGLGTLEGA
jgi:serine/threonine protein kinase/tetratricopeptide (TPR) repeat protein